MSALPGMTFQEMMLRRMLEQAQSLKPQNYPLPPAMNVGYAPGMGPGMPLGMPGPPPPPGPATQPPTNLLAGSPMMQPQAPDLLERMRLMQQAWMERNAGNRFLPQGGGMFGGMGDMIGRR